ncbi:MAG: zf-HC2 domain-containing protein [Fimbriimonadales bacterium]|nr:zf-HC2 domain-containing protein [Fimbriimonadales bacterium]
MRCEQVRVLLNDYLGGALSPAIAESLQAHLSACAACQREWQFQRGIWRTLERMPAPEAPADLHARIMTYVRGHQRARAQSQRWLVWRWVGAAAAAAALFLLGFFSARPGGVMAGFGSSLLTDQQEKTLPHPVPAGIRLEWREVGGGERVPILHAALNREASATLAWSAEPDLPPRLAQRIWQGRLQPGKAVEIPLPLLMQQGSSRHAATLWWTIDDQHRAFFVPEGYPPMARATLRLRANLSEALALLADAYQTPIEWLPATHNTNPLVVLDVRDAPLADALNQLLLGTGYTTRQENGHWRVLPR